MDSHKKATNIRKKEGETDQEVASLGTMDESQFLDSIHHIVIRSIVAIGCLGGCDRRIIATIIVSVVFKVLLRYWFLDAMLHPVQLIQHLILNMDKKKKA
jgi:hypothetical protein